MSKQSFINYLKFEKRYSEHTINAYDTELVNFYNFLDSESLAFSEVDYAIVRHYLSLMKEKGREASSINRTISTLRSYYKFLLREGVVTANPMTMVRALKMPKKLPVVVDQEKMLNLLNQKSAESNTFEEMRDFIVLELLFGTGIRLSELLTLQERDIDLYNKTVLIFGKRGKERLVPIHHTLVNEVKKYIKRKYEESFQNNSPYLIVTNEGKRAYPKLIYRIVNKSLSSITMQQKRSPHVLRHSFATTLLNNGADLNAIKELLGHAGLAATQVYTHNSVERLKSIYKQAHPKA